MVQSDHIKILEETIISQAKYIASINAYYKGGK